MTERPNLSARLVFGLALALSVTLMVARAIWEGLADPPIVPRGWAVLPFAFLLGLGLAVLIGLGWANRHRWRAVMRPNRGRVIGALVLGFVTPMVVFSWLPWIFGGFWLMLGLPALQNGDPAPFFLGLLLTGAAALFWYFPVCLIVSGIRRRWLRVALFALMFWAAYAGIILVLGNQKFAL